VIIFDSSGTLNIAHDASDLPEEGSERGSRSGAMTRCKNLRINEKGKARTRDGSAKLNSSAINQNIFWIEEQAGARYTFAGADIYKDESSIASGLTAAQWATVKYNSFNDSTDNIFALNGTDRKRIEDSSVFEWGIDAPTVAPILAVGGGQDLTGEYNAKYTYVRKVGTTAVSESDPSPRADLAIVLNGQSLAVAVVQPTDPQVTHIRLYRTLANGAVYFADQEVPIAKTWAYGFVHPWEEEEEFLVGTGYHFTVEDTTHVTYNCFLWEENFLDRGTVVENPNYGSGVLPVDPSGNPTRRDDPDANYDTYIP